MPNNALAKQLEAVAAAMDISFTLRNNPISSSEVFSVTGLLPAIARRADQLCSLCLGYGIGATFEEAEGSVLGLKVTFDEVTPQILRLFCITDVLHELRKASQSKKVIAMDELLYD